MKKKNPRKIKYKYLENRTCEEYDRDFEGALINKKIIPIRDIVSPKELKIGRVVDLTIKEDRFHWSKPLPDSMVCESLNKLMKIYAKTQKTTK